MSKKSKANNLLDVVQLRLQPQRSGSILPYRNGSSRISKGEERNKTKNQTDLTILSILFFSLQIYDIVSPSGLARMQLATVFSNMQQLQH